MPAPAILALPYHVARTPLTILDLTVVQRLPERSPVRRGFAKAFGSLDLIAGRVFADQSLLRQGSEQLASASPTRRTNPDSTKRPAETRPSAANGASGTAETGTTTAPPKAAQKRPSPAAQAREDVVTKRQPANARANKNLSTIRQQLAQTEAIAEAHEHLAEEREEERTEDSSTS